MNALQHADATADDAGQSNCENGYENYGHFIQSRYYGAEESLLGCALDGHNQIQEQIGENGEPRQEIRRKVPDILRLVGLSTKLHSYPDELSGGEQQRVSIARAFVNHPPLLLADEPTGNLDPETSIGIMQLIYRINRTGTTVVVATHDSTMVDKMRRRVVELREGRIIRDELSGLYRPDESTTEFAIRLRGELGIGHEGHPN